MKTNPPVRKMPQDPREEQRRGQKIKPKNRRDSWNVHRQDNRTIRWEK